MVPVGTVLVVIGGDSDGAERCARRDCASRLRPRSPRRKDAPRRSSARSRRSSASTSTRSTGTGPQGRVTEADVRGAATPGEGRREPLRGVRRVIAEHMTKAHREVPAVTWVEECDFSGVDLKLLVPTTLKASRRRFRSSRS